MKQLVGQRSQPDSDRRAYRWGSESGFCIVDGQRVPLERPRVRSRQRNCEIPLGSYEIFQKASLGEETVWQKIMHGLTMRSYKEVIEQFADAYRIEKSATSEHFIQASRRKLDELMKRSLAHLSLAAILIDGTIFKGQHLMVAVGLDRLGTKVVLGLRQGATENAAVVEGLLGDLADRGVNFNEPRLYLVDGSKAIRRAVVNFAGDAAFLPRCQVHKIRNVTDYLPESQRPAVKFRMRAAYLMPEAADAKSALFRLHALCSTNAIESSFSVVDKICSQVKRWQGSDHRLRWVGSALLFTESRWNKLHGYRHMPILINALDAAYRLRTAKSAAAASAA